MHRHFVGIFGLAFFLCVSSVTVAADGGTYEFPKGTLTLQTYGTYAAGLGSDTGTGSGTLGLSYYLFNNFSLGLEASGYSQRVGSRDGNGYGVSAILRHHVIQFHRTTLFIDASFGPVESSLEIPRGGTYFNYITRTGLGITYPLGEHVELMSGVRYFHLSNARLEGSRRNPSINGIEGFLGVMYKF